MNKKYVAYDPVIDRHLTVDDLIRRDAQGGLRRLLRGVHYWWLETRRRLMECFDAEHRAARKSGNKQFDDMLSKCGPLPPARKFSTIDEDEESLCSELSNAELLEYLRDGQRFQKPAARIEEERRNSPSGKNPNGESPATGSVK